MAVIKNHNFMALVSDIAEEIVENKITDFNSTYDNVEDKLIQTFKLTRLNNNDWLIKLGYPFN